MKRTDVKALLIKDAGELRKDILALEKDIALAKMVSNAERKNSAELSDKRQKLAIMKSTLNTI